MLRTYPADGMPDTPIDTFACLSHLALAASTVALPQLSARSKLQIRTFEF